MKKTDKKRAGAQGVVALAPVMGVLAGLRQGLHELVVSAGLGVLGTLLEEDRARLCGPRYGHTEHGASRAGHARGELAMGGRRVEVRRPRVRSVGGEEIALPTWEHFASDDPLHARAVEQMLVGVATRGCTGSSTSKPPSSGRRVIRRRSSTPKTFCSRPRGQGGRAFSSFGFAPCTAPATKGMSGTLPPRSRDNVSSCRATAGRVRASSTSASSRRPSRVLSRGTQKGSSCARLARRAKWDPQRSDLCGHELGTGAACGQIATYLVGGWRGTKLLGPSPAAPFQTVHADFPHTAYRWSSRLSFAQSSRSGLSRTIDTGLAPETTLASKSRPSRPAGGALCVSPGT